LFATVSAQQRHFETTTRIDRTMKIIDSPLRRRNCMVAIFKPLCRTSTPY